MAVLIDVETKLGERLVGVLVEKPKYGLFAMMNEDDGIFMLREKVGKISYIAYSEIRQVRKAKIQ